MSLPANAGDCSAELQNGEKAMHVVMDECVDVGTFSLGGLYNGNWETLTYYYPRPWKGTFLSVRVGDTVYVDSELPDDGVSMNKYVITLPAVQDNVVRVQWMLPDNVLVEESLEIVGNSTLIHLRLKNDNPSKTVTVGARLLIDTMLGDNDGAPIYVPGDELRVAEKAYSGQNLNFKYWKAYNKQDRPNIVSTGILSGKLTYPDKLIIANWKKSSRTSWEYVPEGASILGDSAVILYYDPAPLESGSTREIITGYGSGEPVLKKITEITEITLSNVTGQYCMGDEVGIKADVGSRIEFRGAAGLEIRNKNGETLYTSKISTGTIKAESVKNMEFAYTIPRNSSTDEYNVTATLYDVSGNVIDRKSTEFSVDAAKCAPPAKPKTREPNWLIMAILLLIIIATLIFIISRRKGEVIVRKVKHGDKVTVSVFNNGELDVKKGVIEDRIVDGAEVDISTLNVRRRGTKLSLEVGTLKAGDKAGLEYRIKGVNVVPKALFRWDGGEKLSN